MNQTQSVVLMPFLQVVHEIVTAAGRWDDFVNGDMFYLKIDSPPYMQLIIEAWDSSIAGEGRRISVAHYFEQEGDLVPDPEVEIRDDGWPIELSQQSFHTQVTIYRADGALLFAPGRKRDVLDFLNETWAPNLRAQKFIEAAAAYALKQAAILSSPSEEPSDVNP